MQRSHPQCRSRRPMLCVRNRQASHPLSTLGKVCRPCQQKLSERSRGENTSTWQSSSATTLRPTGVVRAESSPEARRNACGRGARPPLMGPVLLHVLWSGGQAAPRADEGTVRLPDYGSAGGETVWWFGLA